MAVWWLSLVFICPLFAIDYSRYRLVRVGLTSQYDARKLDIIGRKYTVDFINLPVANRTSRLVVANDRLDKFLNEVAGARLSYTVNAKDVGRLIQEESDGQTDFNDGFRAYRPYKDLSEIFVKFPRYAEILRWMNQLVRDYPGLAQTDNIGKTYEGKPTTILKISKNGFGQKPVIWIDGAIHGREWISATTVLYLANKLLREYSAGRTDMVDRYDWVLLPVVNPDGYEFSHSSCRLWRKNRKPIVMNCYGVDLNRNFGYHWGVTKGSVSTQGCSDEFGGEGPFSEPETENMRSYMATLQGRLQVYLSFHSYSQLWLVPWGYTSTKPDDYERMVCVAEQAVKAAKDVHGLDYRVGTLSDVLYAAAGGSFDWAKANGAPYSYTVELRPSADKVGAVFDRGFLAATSEIVPAGEEMWAAVSKLVDTVHKGVCE